MHEAVLSPLATWQNFYVIIGSAAATLTGLMFVVATVLLLVIGIHNAWDNVRYIALELSQPQNKRQDQ